ncbi:MAG: SIS domain-containing protein [Bacteroidales bacterium]|nr:SIS domain-containing protein [Bacteroidales bacterium]
MLKYFTYKEIRQQPDVWQKTYNLLLARKNEIKSFIDKFLDQDYQVILTGAGTSAYIGDALEPALYQTRFRNARAISTTDILTFPGFYFNGDSKVLLISFARSGNSPESVGTVKAVEQTAGQVAHIFITCNGEGKLAQMHADNILTILLPPETNDLSLAMTSSYSTMFLACSLIAQIGDIESQRSAIDTLAECVRKMMDRYEDDIREIASKDFKRAVFLGSGTLKGVAEESRLKLQELTDGAVMCAFDSFLGFRHGPKAVVHPDCLVVYFLSPESSTQRYELDLVKQIKAGNRHHSSVLVCQRRPDIDPSVCDFVMETGLPDGLPGCFGGVAYVVVAQLLGFYKSLNCGLNPDTPSISGNISRVVEGVTLYI